MDDTEQVKLKYLSLLKKKYWRNKSDEIVSLLPVCFKHSDFSVDKLRVKGLEKYNYDIKYKKITLFSIYFICSTDGKQSLAYINYNSDTKPSYNISGKIRFMSKEEITNLKRIIVIKSMLKK